MLKKTLAFVCAGLLIPSTGALAQNVGDGLEPEPEQSTTRVGTRGANWLAIPIGGRAQALGGQGTALVKGVEALYWNVANFAETDAVSIGWTYSELFKDADISLMFFGGIIPLNEVSAIGVSVTSLNSGDIVRTTETFPDGGDPQFGETFKFSGFAGSAAYARQITDRLGVGAGLKFVSEGIDNAKADWLVVDLGLLFRTGLIGLTFGAAIQNIGGSARAEGPAIEEIINQNTGTFPVADNIPVQFNTTELLIPTTFRFSVVFDVTGTPEAWFPQAGPNNSLKLVGDIRDSIDSSLESAIGFEYAYKEFVFGRIGKRFFNEDRTSDFRDFGHGAAIGGGIRVPLLNRYLGFDYAYTDSGLLDNIQTFSITFGS